MSSFLDKFLPAKYAGFPFLVESESKSGGKKTATHEYVNSNKRFTEELGLIPPIITMVGVIHGKNAIQDRASFERTLNFPGVQTLVHPVYGELQVKSTKYSVSSEQTSIGVFKFELNFEVTEEVISLSPETILAPSVVSANADDCKKAISDKVKASYIVPDKPTFLDRLAKKADNIYKKVFDEVDSVQNKVQSSVSTFTKKVNDIRSKIRTVVQKALTIREALDDLYRTGLDVSDIPSDLKKAWEELTDFGFDNDIDDIGGDTKSVSASKKVDTRQRIDEDISKNRLNEHTRLTALTNLYEAVAFSDFETSEDIEKDRKTLNDSYNKLMEIDNLSDDQLSKDLSLASDPAVRRAIQVLRANTNRVLQQKEQNAWKVSSLETQQTSMALATYLIYGNLDNLDLITNLNPNINPSNFDTVFNFATK